MSAHLGDIVQHFLVAQARRTTPPPMISPPASATSSAALIGLPRPHAHGSASNQSRANSSAPAALPRHYPMRQIIYMM
jgi:hypothetical protein